jgi:alkylated DNA repair dioxygenase AlkB
MTARKTRRGQAELFGTVVDGPEGFSYRDDVIAPEDEARFVAQFAVLPFQPFEFHGYLGKRRVVSFGWRYDYAGRALRESETIPAFLLPLREKAAAFAGLDGDDLRQILVTEYAPGAGIGWHRDKPMFEDVVAISFLASCVLRFRRKAGPVWERRSQTVQPRSAYLLRGPARQLWQHSVPPVAELRYSVTFRNFVRGEERV